MRKIVVSEFVTLAGSRKIPMAPFMKQTVQILSKAIPNAQFRTIEGQTHAVASEVIAPVLEFFKK